MAVSSRITWTDSTWNPHSGCRKVSEGCKFCYMHRIMDNNNPSIVRKNSSEFTKPLNWKEGRKIFTCSMSDFFIEKADEWREELWEVIKQTPQHTYLILTKRPERIQDCLPKDWGKEKYNHIWLGVSVENQKEVERIRILKETKCALRWVSFEPLLANIQLTHEELSSFQWAVIGGESGNETGKYTFRKTELHWFMLLMNRLSDYNIPIFFKQFGSWYHYNELMLKDRKGENYCKNFPKGFRVRQYPS